MLCMQDMLHSNPKAMVFGKANDKGFLEEFKPISPFVMNKSKDIKNSLNSF